MINSSVAEQKAFFLSMDKHWVDIIKKDKSWLRPMDLSIKDMDTEDHQLYENITYKQQIKPNRAQGKNHIQLAIIMMNQNDELINKIKQVRLLIEEEEVKTNIFKNKLQKQRQLLHSCRQKLQNSKQNISQSPSFNQSHIPNKYTELSSTINTNGWLSEILSKEEVESLWPNRMKPLKQQNYNKTKTFTIDLSSLMSSASKNKVQDSSRKPQAIKMSASKVPFKEVNKKLSSRMNINKPSLKLQLGEKQKQFNKTLSQLRNVKKMKINPEK